MSSDPAQDLDTYFGSADHVRDLAAQYGLRKSSGVRSPQHNAAVGGARHSYHLTGNAEDYVGDSDSMRAFHDNLKASAGDKLPELLDEGNHIHVAFKGQGKAGATAQSPDFDSFFAGRAKVAPTATPHLTMPRIAPAQTAAVPSDSGLQASAQTPAPVVDLNAAKITPIADIANSITPPPSPYRQRAAAIRSGTEKPFARRPVKPSAVTLPRVGNVSSVSGKPVRATPQPDAFPQAYASAAQEQAVETGKPAIIGEVDPAARRRAKSLDAVRATEDAKHNAVTNVLRHTSADVVSGLADLPAGIYGAGTRMLADLSGNTPASQAIRESGQQAAQNVEDYRAMYGGRGAVSDVVHGGAAMLPQFAAAELLPGSSILTKAGLPHEAVGFAAAASANAYGHGASVEDSIKAGLEAALMMKMAGKLNDSVTEQGLRGFLKRTAANTAAPMASRMAVGGAPVPSIEDAAFGAIFAGMHGEAPRGRMPVEGGGNESTDGGNQTENAGRVAADAEANNRDRERSLSPDSVRPATSSSAVNDPRSTTAEPRPVLMPPIVRRGEIENEQNNIERTQRPESAVERQANRAVPVETERRNNVPELRTEGRQPDNSIIQPANNAEITSPPHLPPQAVGKVKSMLPPHYDELTREQKKQESPYAFFRIQDARTELPERSKNYWTGNEDTHMGGVSAFGELYTASRDLLGKEDVDGHGIVYSEGIAEDGGKPVLSVFGGHDLGDESPNVNGYSVEAQRNTEHRFSPDEVLNAWKKAVVKEFPDDAGSVKDMDWDKLAEVYNLKDFEVDAYKALKGILKEGTQRDSPQTLTDTNRQALKDTAATIKRASNQSDLRETLDGVLALVPKAQREPIIQEALKAPDGDSAVRLAVQRAEEVTTKGEQRADGVKAKGITDGNDTIEQPITGNGGRVADETVTAKDQAREGQAEPAKAITIEGGNEATQPVEHHALSQPRTPEGQFNGPPDPAAYTPKAARAERSLPKTLESQSLPKGSNLLYDRVTHESTITTAKAHLESKGVDGAAEYVRTAEPSAEATATGYAVIDEYTKQAANETDPIKRDALFAKANAIAEDMSVKMTSYGQAVEAAKTVSEFGVASAVKVGQKTAEGNGKRLTTRDTADITRDASTMKSAQAEIARLQERVNEYEAKEKKKTESRKARITKEFDAAEVAARERLAKLNIVPSPIPVNPSERGAISLRKAVPQDVINDLASVMAAKVARGEKALADYRTEMATEFGEHFVDNRQRIEQAANRALKEANRIEPEMRPLSAREQLAADVRQAEVAERKAVKDAESAERQARRTDARDAQKAQKQAEVIESRRLADEAREQAKAARAHLADERKAAEKIERASLKWDAGIKSDARANTSDPVAVGAEKLATNPDEMAFRREMATRFGMGVSSREMDAAFKSAYEKVRDAKAADREAQEVRRARLAGASSPEGIEQVRKQLKEQQKAHRDAQLGLARTYDRLSGGRAFRLLSAYRKGMGLLSSPKTHARNILGNFAYQAFDEVARVPGAIMDFALSGVTKQRGLTGPSPTGMLDSTLAALKVGGKEALDIVRTGQTAEEAAKLQIPQEVNSGSKIIDAALNATYRLLAAEDRIFYNGALRRNLYDRARSQALTEVKTGELKRGEVGKRTQELVKYPHEQLLTDAQHDALVATFNNDNRLSDSIKRARGSLTPGQNFALDLVMPYDRTPTNIVARMIEASPAGYLKNAKQLARAVMSKAFTQEEQRQFSQTFGRATVGTAMLALGYRLAAAGLMTGQYDDDERKRTENREKKEVGQQAGAIKIGGQWYQISGLAPLGNLMAAGATLYEKGIGGSASIALDSVFEQPLMRASKEIVDAAKSDSKLQNLAGSVAGGFIPAIGSDVATMTDEKARKTFGFEGQIKRRVPYLRNTLPEDEGIEHRKSWALDPFHTTTDKGQTPTQIKNAIVRQGRFDQGFADSKGGAVTPSEQMKRAAMQSGKLSEDQADALDNRIEFTPAQLKFKSKTFDEALKEYNSLPRDKQAEYDELMADKFDHLEPEKVRGGESSPRWKRYMQLEAEFKEKHPELYQ